MTKLKSAVLTGSYSALFLLLLLPDGVGSRELALCKFAEEAGMVSTGATSASAAMATLNWQPYSTQISHTYDT